MNKTWLNNNYSMKIIFWFAINKFHIIIILINRASYNNLLRTRVHFKPSQHRHPEPTENWYDTHTHSEMQTTVNLQRQRDAKNQAKELVQDRERRTNLKSKRKRNIVKKAIELSHMCNMDILILIRDREMDKLFQYSSGKTEATDLFTVEKAYADF